MINLFQNIGFFSIALGLVAWIFRSLGSKYLEEKLELHKSELDKNVREFQQKLDLEIEKERNKLKLEFAKYSRIHEERLVIIKEFYKKMIDLHKAMKELTFFMWPSTGESKEERRKRVVDQTIDCYENLKKYYLYEKIMFNEDTIKLIDELIEAFSESLRLDTFEDRWGPEDKAMADSKKEASDIVDNKIPKILSKLETDFRDQIGSVN